MAARWANGASGVRRVLGASSARVVLAMSASSMLTLVVAAPMAYQAHSARQDQTPTVATQTTTIPPSVLGTSTMVTTTEQAESPETTSPSTPTTSAPGASSTTTSVAGTSPGGRSTPTTSPGGSAATTTTSVPWFVSPAPPPTTPSTVPDAPTTTTVPAPPTTDTPPTTAPEPQPNSDGLYFSLLVGLQPSQPLQDARLSLPTYVFADVPDASQVVFALDGQVTATELFAPWELFGGLPLVPALLPPGPHTVQADITAADGHVETRVAVFTVIG